MIATVELQTGSKINMHCSVIYHGGLCLAIRAGKSSSALLLASITIFPHATKEAPWDGGKEGVSAGQFLRMKMKEGKKRNVEEEKKKTFEFVSFEMPKASWGLGPGSRVLLKKSNFHKTTFSEMSCVCSCSASAIGFH